MLIDLVNEKEKIKKNMHNFNYKLGKKTHLIIYNFRHPIMKKKHEKTMYYYFDCKVISKDLELIPYGKHTIQLPSKRVVLPMIEELEDKERMDDKEICVTIEKKDNHNFDITIHH